MNSRKSKTPGSTPSLGRATLPKGPALSSEYLEAIHVLSEANMAQACAWLLSEQDYNDKPNNNKHNDKEKSLETETETETTTKLGQDHQRLLDFYSKCRDAVEVVKKQKGAAMALPPSIPVIPQVRAGGAVGAAVGPPGSRARDMAHKRAMQRNLIKSKTAVGGGNPLKRGVGGNQNIKAGTGVASDSASKKARAMMPPPPPQPQSEQGGGDASAPPPSALSFLAKLNKGSKESSSGDGGGSSSAATSKVPTPTGEDGTLAGADRKTQGRRNPPRGASPR